MEKYTLLQVLQAGTVVEVDFTMAAVVVWNESATFKVFTQVAPYGEIPAFEQIACFTNHNATSGTAAGIAKAWLASTLPTV